MKIKEFFREYNKSPLLSESLHYESYWENRGAGEQAYLKWSPKHRMIILSEILEDGASLLDVGCGNCSFFDLLSKKKPNMKLFGLEVSETGAELGRGKGYDVTVKDLTSEPVEGRYDYITILNVLEHIYHAEEMVLNVRDAFVKGCISPCPILGTMDTDSNSGYLEKCPTPAATTTSVNTSDFGPIRIFSTGQTGTGYRSRVHGEIGMDFAKNTPPCLRRTYCMN